MAGLIEVGIGTLPQVGGLYDSGLKWLSAESIYDRIATDRRRFRGIATLRGLGLSDLVCPSEGRPDSDAIDLDEYYRRAMSRALKIISLRMVDFFPQG